MYRGKLPIGNLELDCYVLDDDKRILSSSSIFEAFGRPSRGIRQIDSFEHHGQLIDLPLFLASKTLFPLMKPNVLPLIEPVEFLDGGTIKKGYKAELLPAMCSIYLDARRQNLLLHHQKKLADKSEILLSAIANIGIKTPPKTIYLSFTIPLSSQYIWYLFIMNFKYHKPTLCLFYLSTNSKQGE